MPAAPLTPCLKRSWASASSCSVCLESMIVLVTADSWVAAHPNTFPGPTLFGTVGEGETPTATAAIRRCGIALPAAVRAIRADAPLGPGMIA